MNTEKCCVLSPSPLIEETAIFDPTNTETPTLSTSNIKNKTINPVSSNTNIQEKNRMEPTPQTQTLCQTINSQINIIADDKMEPFKMSVLDQIIFFPVTLVILFLLFTAVTLKNCISFVINGFKHCFYKIYNFFYKLF